MKLFRILASAAAIACLTVSTAFAAPLAPGANDIKTQQKDGTAKNEKMHDKKFNSDCAGFEKDPVKALECRKEKVKSLLKEGKITKEKADAITARIDAKIKKVNEFNKLSVQEKRVKLINDFKVFVDSRVKEGKLTKEKADTMVRDFSDKVTKWDGKGYPMFHGMKHKGKGGHHDSENKKTQ